MTAINHALTGALIGLVVGNPAIAIPAAFLSHFVLDALPHFGSRRPDEVWLKSRAFSQLLIVDIVLCFVLVIILGLSRPQNWLLACICAFIATSPDFAWLPNYLRTRSAKPIKKANWFTNFSSRIQWFQRPSGAIVEIAWATAALLALWPFVL